MTTYELKTPITEEAVRKLRVNDLLYITGTILQQETKHMNAL